MKNIWILLVVLALLLTAAACGNGGRALNMEPQVSQMKAICELAVMDCYYHNVAKYFQEDADNGFLGIGKKDKHFWIEYGGVVRLGVDVSLVKIELNGDQVTITIPEAKVLSCKVDSATLNEDSFIVDKNSATVTGQDEVAALAEADERLKQTAANDRVLLSNAQQRAMELLEEYVRNIGTAVGKEYRITWIYVDDEGNPSGTGADTNTQTAA